jgi:hypothetical protein
MDSCRTKKTGTPNNTCWIGVILNPDLITEHKQRVRANVLYAMINTTYVCIQLVLC